MNFDAKKQELYAASPGYYKVKSKLIVGKYLVEFQEVKEVILDKDKQGSITGLNFIVPFGKFSFWKRLKIAFQILLG